MSVVPGRAQGHTHTRMHKQMCAHVYAQRTHTHARNRYLHKNVRKQFWFSLVSCLWRVFVLYVKRSKSITVKRLNKGLI